MRLFLLFILRLALATISVIVYKYAILHKSDPVTDREILYIAIAGATSVLFLTKGMEAGRLWVLDIVEPKQDDEEEL
jgi:hypothetical protein